MTRLYAMSAFAIAALCAPLAGCFLDRGGVDFGANDDAGPPPDANPLIADADPDTPDAIQLPDAPPGTPDAAPFDCNVWNPAPAHFNPCAIPEPNGVTLNLNMSGTYRYDTVAGSLMDPGGTSVPHASDVIDVGGVPVRVVSVLGFSMSNNAQLRAEGTHPLLIASWSTIAIANGSKIDVSSAFGGTPGAGADPMVCGVGTGVDGLDNTNGGGGGGGGAFQGKGGGGSAGDNGNTGGGAGGMAVAMTPTGIRGGCSGGTGGDGQGVGGPGGSGGGALQLTALSTIQIDGVLHAGGAGGGGVDSLVGNRNAGGGGGSGGMIGLEAMDVTIDGNAALAANGGGGAEGSNGETTQPGENGREDGQAAAGSSGVSDQGGDGGDGGALSSVDGADTSDVQKRGGGGGGGGGGFTIVRGTVDINDTPVISPAISSLP